LKIIAVNGSARKNWNTHILLNKALEGAESAGAQTELINLYDLDYKGCIGCLGCKIRGSETVGYCAVKDGLSPVLDKIAESDGFILGSPIYLGDVTAMMRALWERLIFQHLNYDDYTKPFLDGAKKTAFIYTMNGSESMIEQYGMSDTFNFYEMMLQTYFGSSVHMTSTETLQVNDYSKYHMAGFDEAQRKERREKVFPGDCRKAYEMGRAIAHA
jgi:multimeric flavodoxin WrbA